MAGPGMLNVKAVRAACPANRDSTTAMFGDMLAVCLLHVELMQEPSPCNRIGLLLQFGPKFWGYVHQTASKRHMIYKGTHACARLSVSISVCLCMCAYIQTYGCI